MRRYASEEDTSVVVALPAGARGVAVNILGKHICRMRTGAWLVDEVINAYMWLLQMRSNEGVYQWNQSRPGDAPAKKPSHFFNSFFFTNLLPPGARDPVYDGVRGFARNILSTGGNVFKLDRLIIPVHVDNAHWCLVVAFVQERKIQCYDSIGQEGTRWMEALREYLRHEAEKWARDGTVARHLLALDEWTLVPTQTRETPQQNNGSDCGVFTCTFAECASEGRAMHFS